ncbi:MAG: hypothetical protein NTX26_00750 [Candidatus Parcubacteria bacterium]|nr:hypothetical protein [Candidatus Parcubacteria bacterium]
MTKEELQEVGTIERKTREAACILANYLLRRILFEDDRQTLEWMRVRTALVCRELFHDHAYTTYKLTVVERPFFMNKAERYLGLSSFQILLVVDAIQQGVLCSIVTDSYVSVLIDYLNNIEGECMTAESTGIIPKEESWDVVP